jgi:hypothetical protein
MRYDSRRPRGCSTMGSNDPDRNAGLTRRELLLGSAALLASSPFARALASAKGGAGITALRLHCSSTRVLAPFACVQAFAPGEIPAGSDVVATLGTFQSLVRNRWPDGSVKLALLAGRADLSANVERSIALNAGTAPVGAPLTEADLLASGISATLTFAPFGSVALGPLIGVASVYGGGQWSPGRVRECYVGAQSSSWLYQAPIGADAHLRAWFEVRLWAEGAVEVLAWIENGWLRVAGAGSRSGTASLSVAGTTRFDAALSLPHHTRAVLASGATQTHWLDSTPPVRVRHDMQHLQRTGLVPAYRARTPASSPLLSRLATSYAPLARNDFPDAMGSAGYHPSIGLLPEWDVACLSSDADPRALTAVYANACSAGRFGLHYRDETTLQPLRFSQYPNLVLTEANSGVGSVGSSSTNTYTGATTGTAPPGWANSHHPSIGYLAYLLSGRRYFLEQLQFAASLGFLKQTDVVRDFDAGLLRTDTGANTTRGAAWALRTLAQAACATPDDDAPLRGEYLASVEANVRYYHQRNIAQPGHPQGVCVPYSDYTSGDGVYQHASWMEDFLTASFGQLIDLRLPLTGNANALLDEFFVWKCASILGRFGEQGVATDYNYRDAAQYNLAVARSDTPDWNGGAGPWYADWGAIYAATTGGANLPASGSTLRNGYFPDPTSYWGNLQPALAYAVTHEVPGALAAYTRMTSASNWPEFVALAHDFPVWSVEPRIASDPAQLFADGFEA